MASALRSTFTTRVGLCVILAAGSAAACGRSSPVAATSQLQLTGGGYFVKLNASSSSCSPAGPAVGFQFGPPLSLTRSGSDATMTLRDGLDTFDLAGTMIGDRLSFSMSAQQSSPLQTTTTSGTGTAIVQDGYISGTFAGDFVLVPGTFTRPSFRCHARDHTIILTRLAQ